MGSVTKIWIWMWKKVGKTLVRGKNSLCVSSARSARPSVLHRLKSLEQHRLMSSVLRTSRSLALPSWRSLVPYSRRTALHIRHTHHTHRQSLRAPQQTTSPDYPEGQSDR